MYVCIVSLLDITDLDYLVIKKWFFKLIVVYLYILVLSTKILKQY